MQQYIFKKYLFLSFIILVFGCDQVIVEDLSNKSIVLNAPGNGLHTTLLTNQFHWNLMEGATSYQLQIVKPDFEFIEQYILDTIITGNVYTYTLFPGSFEWRVKALNNAYESPFSTFQLNIDSTSSLSGMPMLLVSPPNGAITNQTAINFRWEEIVIAESYHLEITEAEGLNDLVHEGDYTGDEAFISLPNGNFNWKLYAANNTPSSSNWSEQRLLTIDSIPPSNPTLIYPTSSDSPIPNTDINFDFNSGVDELTNTFDSIWIASDILFFGVVSEGEVQNGETYSDSLGLGTYFWKVRTIDQAGNGTTSSISSFEVE